MIQHGAYQPLALQQGRAVDMGGFKAVVLQSDTPTVDPSDKLALFTVTIEVVEITDPTLVEWFGQPVERGAQITAMVRVPLPAP